VTRLLDFEFDTGSDAGAEQEPGALDTGSSARLALFRHTVRSLISSSANGRKSLREAVVRRLLSAREPYAGIGELLDLCSSSANPDRLDVAIDVLAATGDLVFRYAWEYVIRDVQQWGPRSSRAYQPNDDHWYVLLRAVARCTAPEDARLRLICLCRHAAYRGIAEAVVEALGDLPSDRSCQVLHEFADRHDDPFIRRLASDVLADVEQ
jgi:hypothetical protein